MDMGTRGDLKFCPGSASFPAPSSQRHARNKFRDRTFLCRLLFVEDVHVPRIVEATF